MIITKECKRCGKKFQTDRNAKMYCSDKCRQEYRYYGEKQTEWECASCGKMFYSERKRKYCKLECQRDNYRGNYRGNYHRPTPERKVSKPKKSLAEINAAAKAEGLSYGQYMVKHGYC